MESFASGRKIQFLYRTGKERHEWGLASGVPSPKLVSSLRHLRLHLLPVEVVSLVPWRLRSLQIKNINGAVCHGQGGKVIYLTWNHFWLQSLPKSSKKRLASDVQRFPASARRLDAEDTFFNEERAPRARLSASRRTLSVWPRLADAEKRRAPGRDPQTQKNVERLAASR